MFAAVLAANCAWADDTPRVVPLGNDDYSIAVKATHKFTRNTEKLKEQAMAAAVQSCAKVSRPAEDCFPLVNGHRLGCLSRMTYLEELESVIVKLHGCEAVPVETVHVEEMFQGRAVWTGDVEVFALTGCTRAERCYAWGLPDERGALEIATVLEIPPVDSAAVAVRVAIAAGARRN